MAAIVFDCHGAFIDFYRNLGLNLLLSLKWAGQSVFLPIPICAVSDESHMSEIDYSAKCMGPRASRTQQPKQY
jgi:hypothetical protein